MLLLTVMKFCSEYYIIYCFVIDSKGFWEWCIILEIAGLLNFDHQCWAEYRTRIIPVVLKVPLVSFAQTVKLYLDGKLASCLCCFYVTIAPGGVLDHPFASTVPSITGVQPLFSAYPQS
jgi:hypothetical protein